MTLYHRAKNFINRLAGSPHRIELFLTLGSIIAMLPCAVLAAHFGLIDILIIYYGDSWSQVIEDQVFWNVKMAILGFFSFGLMSVISIFLNFIIIMEEGLKQVHYFSMMETIRNTSDFLHMISICIKVAAVTILMHESFTFIRLPMVFKDSSIRKLFFKKRLLHISLAIILLFIYVIYIKLILLSGV